MWLSISRIFSILDGTIKGDVILFSTAMTTPSDVFIPTAVDPSYSIQYKLYTYYILYMYLDCFNCIFNLKYTSLRRKCIHSSNTDLYISMHCDCILLYTCHILILLRTFSTSIAASLHVARSRDYHVTNFKQKEERWLLFLELLLEVYFVLLER